jgi:hypothetical protein
LAFSPYTISPDFLLPEWGPRQRSIQLEISGPFRLQIRNH